MNPNDKIIKNLVKTALSVQEIDFKKEIESLKKENEELKASFNNAAINFAQLQVRFGKSESELSEAKDIFRWMNAKGGLGFDIHGRIKDFLNKK